MDVIKQHPDAHSPLSLQSGPGDGGNISACGGAWDRGIVQIDIHVNTSSTASRKCTEVIKLIKKLKTIMK